MIYARSEPQCTLLRELRVLTPETRALTIVMILVIVAPFVGSAEAVSAPDVVITSVYWGTNPLGGVSVHPGDSNIPLSIVLSNAGDAAARDINAKLFLAPPFSYVYYTDGNQVSADTVEQSAGDIQAGFSFTLRFALTVASDSAAGIHRLTLAVSYKTARELRPINVPQPIRTILCPLDCAASS